MDHEHVQDPGSRPRASGKAGAAARREHERRKAGREANNAEREARVRARHPRIGGLILALQGTPPAPQTETRWARGAEGEELVAQALARHCPNVRVLHDRRIRGSRANIDHIAVAASGVWVIDTKRYKGKLQVVKPFLSKPHLKIAGRDQTKLVAGLRKQVELVRRAVADVGLDVRVHGCLCFIETELPLLGTPSIEGFLMLGRKGLAKRLNASGSVTEDGAAIIAAALAERFPAA